MSINSKGLFFSDLLDTEPADAFAVNFRRNISRELLKRCSELELTPGKLAKKASIPLSTLNNVLNGVSVNPGVLTLLSICDGLELHLGEVIQTAFEQARAQTKNTGGDL